MEFLNTKPRFRVRFKEFVDVSIFNLGSSICDDKTSREHTQPGKLIGGIDKAQPLH
uniref:Uncharacterized protein n=1 Tax=viral metagenome TaxID=1070528 RepID=A0A6C0C949_9ZZZZ